MRYVAVSKKGKRLSRGDLMLKNGTKHVAFDHIITPQAIRIFRVNHLDPNKSLIGETVPRTQLDLSIWDSVDKRWVS